MKKTLIFILVLIFVLGFLGYLVFYRTSAKTSVESKQAKDLYYCPMHPNFTSDKPGDCPICGMSLVKRQPAEKGASQTPGQSQRKILYYRNPMNPTVTSPVPAKDQMGMDYVPVYEEETTQSQQGMVYINPEKQQLIGVKKEKIQKRKLSGQILTVGRVTYDPALFNAQQEYLAALKSNKSIQKSNGDYIDTQSAAIIEAAKQRLVIMGMSEAEINELRRKDRPEQNLYLPGKEDKTIWVYLTVYEYEAELVKEGTPIEARSQAYPGQTFEGRIVAIAPLLDSATRTLKVRALVDNPENKLKLEMYVDAAINYDLGDRLAVPEEAVLHTGTNTIVFIAKPNGYFEPRTVTLGAKAQKFYEVLRGLAENEEVVTSGNFLIDSESKLNAALSQMSEPNR